MRLHPIPAFSDNYIWALVHDRQALVVDPGDSLPVLAFLTAHHLELQSILVTHHHADHVGGVQTLVERTGATVLAPAHEWAGLEHHPVQRVAGGQVWPALGLNWSVMDVPGHTAGHVAYVCSAVPLDTEGCPPVLFCGDTLFSGGCGRLFEGTPAQMLASLDALAALPDDTQVCCTHEYTLSNLRFAVAVEPRNAELLNWQSACLNLRAQGQPTLPSHMARERQINPFLRVRYPEVRRAACPTGPLQPDAQSDVAVLAALREWKNRFQ